MNKLFALAIAASLIAPPALADGINSNGGTPTGAAGGNLSGNFPSPGLAIPYFSASLTTSQTVTSGTPAKVQFATKVADSNGWYDNVTNFRFTPLQAGKYRVHVQVYCNGTTTTICSSSIYKNGTSYATSLKQAASIANYTDSLDAIIPMNGTTDFLEGWASVTGTGTSQVLGSGGTTLTSWFEAQFISP